MRVQLKKGSGRIAPPFDSAREEDGSQRVDVQEHQPTIKVSNLQKRG